MRYAEYLNRSMDQLTTAVWEQLITANAPVTPAPKTILTACPCCHKPVVLEVALSLLSPIPTDDAVLPGDSDDTQLELAALTHTDFVAV